MAMMCSAIWKRCGEYVVGWGGLKILERDIEDAYLWMIGVLTEDDHLLGIDARTWSCVGCRCLRRSINGVASSRRLMLLLERRRRSKFGRK